MQNKITDIMVSMKGLQSAFKSIHYTGQSRSIIIDDSGIQEYFWISHKIGTFKVKEKTIEVTMGACCLGEKCTFSYIVHSVMMNAI